MKTLHTILFLSGLAALGYAQDLTLPVDTEITEEKTYRLPWTDEITDTQGRNLVVTILSKTDTTIQVRRGSDGKTFDLSLDKISPKDRKWIEQLPKTEADNPKPPTSSIPTPTQPADPNNLVFRRVSDEYKSVNLGSNQTALVKSNSGAAAVIQITKMGAHKPNKTIGEVSISHSTYRWKFRAKAGDPIQTGTGELTHATKLTEQPNGGTVNVPTPDDSSIINAGGIQLNWHPSNTEVWAFLTYSGARGTVDILPGEDFDKDF